MNEVNIDIQNYTMEELKKDLKYKLCEALECPIEITSEANPVTAKLKISKPEVSRALKLNSPTNLEMFNMVLELFPELLPEILNAQLKMGFRGEISGSTLHYVLFEKDLPKELALFLINIGIDPNMKDNRGMTPLHLCASGYGSNRRHEITELLLAHGADVNLKDNEGNTPLHYAVSFAQSPETKNGFDTVEILIEHGADINAMDKKGNTPFSAITTPEIARLFIKQGGSLDLFQAISMGIYDRVVELINAGADVNMRNGDGNTLLQIAVKRSQAPIVEVLLKHAADPDIADERQPFWTPLIYAAWENLGQIAKILIDHGADRFIREPVRHMNALEIAEERRSLDVIHVLRSPTPLEQKAVIPASNSASATPATISNLNSPAKPVQATNTDQSKDQPASLWKNLFRKK